MATRGQAFPSNYLGKDDVQHPITATIDHVTGESVGQGAEQEERRVAHFKEPNVKPMILNSGNWQTIESLSGRNDDDEWGGTRIEIYVDPSVSFGGRRVGGLRVRQAGSNARPAADRSAPAPSAAKPSINGHTREAAYAAFQRKAKALTPPEVGPAWGKLIKRLYPNVNSSADLMPGDWAIVMDQIETATGAKGELIEAPDLSKPEFTEETVPF